MGRTTIFRTMERTTSVGTSTLTGQFGYRLRFLNVPCNGQGLTYVLSRRNYTLGHGSIFLTLTRVGFTIYVNGGGIVTILLNIVSSNIGHGTIFSFGTRGVIGLRGFTLPLVDHQLTSSSGTTTIVGGLFGYHSGFFVAPVFTTTLDDIYITRVSGGVGLLWRVFIFLGVVGTSGKGVGQHTTRYFCGTRV